MWLNNDLLVFLHDGLPFVVGTALLWGLFKWASKRRWLARENLPLELAKASIWAVEKFIYCNSPVYLSGKADRIFLTLNKQLCVVDTKTHKQKKVFQSDIIQLSVYAFILRHNRRINWHYAVAPFGFVRLDNCSGVAYLKVKLLSDEALISLAQDYLTIRDGKQQPKYCRNPTFCRNCSYRYRCDQPAG